MVRKDLTCASTFKFKKNKLNNERRYIIKINLSADVEKDKIKKEIIVEMKLKHLNGHS